MLEQTTSRAPGNTPLPVPVLEVKDVIALIVGLVIGVGIFKLPSLVAANAMSETWMLAAWVLGGAISLIGALCYAELATTYPHAGGDYHYLNRAFGKNLSFLFAWARLTVISSGSIALLAFVFGDYASQLLRLGSYSTSIYAALAVILLTGVHILGIRQGKSTQNLLTVLEVLGLLSVIVAGLAFALPTTPNPTPDAVAGNANPLHAAFGLTMVFVLLTFGGWNEAAYVSAELKDVRRNMAKALIYSIAIITLLYLLVNVAYLKGLGFTAMAKSEVIAADLLKAAWGESGAKLISIIIAISALTSISATILTAARTNFALGRDFPLFAALGRWHSEKGSPINALLIQGVLVLALIGLGTLTRKGFETMVDFTAPVFWLFFLLTGVSLFILRWYEPHVKRHFKVPLYPVLPMIFCITCGYLLYSSLAYTGLGALIGVAVLTSGVLVLLWGRRYETRSIAFAMRGED